MENPLANLPGEHLEHVLELAGDVIYKTDAAGRITYVNQRVREMLGYKPEQLVGAHYLTLVAPEARSEIFRFYGEQSRRATGRTYREFPAVRADGAEIWVGQHVQVVLEGGQPVGFIGIARDKTEIQHAKGKLAERDARLTLLSRLSAQEGDALERIRDGLRQACTALGLSMGLLSRITGDSYEVRRYWPQDCGLYEGQIFELGDTYCQTTWQDRVVTAIEDAGETHASHPCFEAFGLRTYLGAPVFVGGRLVGTVSLSDPEARSTGFTTADTDFVSLFAQWVGSVLEQSVALDRIRAAEGRMEAIVSTSADGILTCNADGAIVSANPAARRMLQVEHEPVGQDVRLFIPAFLKTEVGGTEAVPAQALRPDGTSFEVELNVSRTEHAGRALLAGIFRDVTERNRHAGQLRRREAALRAFFDGTPFLMGIISLRNGNLVHLSANSAAIEFFGLLKPKSGTAELGGSGEIPQSARWERACGQCLAQRTPVRFETRVRERWLNVTINLIDDAQQGVPRFSYVVEDVTTQHEQADELARRKAEFEAIYRSIPYAAVFADTGRGIVAVNPAFQSIFGYKGDKVIGSEASFLLANPEQPFEPGQSEVRFRRKDGSEFDAEAIRVDVRAADGSTLGSLALIRDVTERNENRERIRMQANILGQVQDAVVVLDHEMRITYWNQGAQALTGYEAEAAEGRLIMRLTPFRWLTADQEQEAINSLLDRGNWKGRLRLRSRSSGVVFVDAVVSLMQDREGEASGMLVVARDVTETVHLERRLRLQARADTLTSLPNRMVLDERIREALVRRDTERQVFALVFIDVDRFKLVNDSLGHAVGDALLQQVAARIRSSLRVGDVVARIGGDEFAVLLNNVENEHQAREAADRLSESLCEPFRVSGKNLPASASMGMVMADFRYKSPDELLRDADTAMYVAKRRARGTCVVFSEAMHEDVSRRFKLESDLAFSIERDQLELYYQPLVNLTNGELTGFEALVRWNHPELGRLSPDEFLPIATERGMLADIDTWVLREAAAQHSAWLMANPRRKGLVMHVNSSSDTVMMPEYGEAVKAAVKDFELPAGALEIEITEHILMENVPEAAKRLKALKRSGVKLAVDDFGTGYSSLNLLHALPVDTVKTDRSLLDPTILEDRGNHILRTIATLTDALGLELVAEGLESELQLRRLQDLGFKVGQGYLFSKPRSAAHSEILLRTPGWVGYWEGAGTEAGDRAAAQPNRQTGGPRRRDSV
ncbi:MAG: PAS domain S-box protein [Rhodothermales bacterium]|nr:PAS domain S-box protein [Rhodothermales bacterium]MBO6779928.1 PAS domain S-box protein [Rhodothermales bacterium]